LSLKKRNDYDVSFRKSAKLLHREPINDRIMATEEMCDKYLDDNEELPADYLLEALADALLYEELSDSSPDKMSRKEYPILSRNQQIRRKSGKELSFKEVAFDVDEVERAWSDNNDPSIYPTYKINEVNNEVYYYSKLNEKIPVTITSLNSCSITVRKLEKGRGDAQRTWAQQVKERDGYQCKNPRCNSRAGIMHAHHIYNYADWPGLRDETTNGITLCEPCHTEFHSIYGKSRTDKENLQEFFA
jgi:hypothetical protein